ncbi:MAG TPA: hypothetical protein VEO54_19240 [Thermoanaerobaculia bacterium]|nr:hypothetical protein [Thermoanaerobaculia bacterium]
MTQIPDTPGPASEPANKFTPDAQERMARLRTMAAEFPDEAAPKPLTSAELRLARSTSAATLENAAVFVEAAPTVGGGVADAVELRDAIAFELAYGGVRDEARALARRVDQAILRRKLKAAKAARGVYRVAKGFVTVDAGDAVRPHVTELKRSLRPRRRRKNDAVPEVQIAAKK